MLPYLSRVFEKLVFNQLYEYLQSVTKLLSHLQIFSFLPLLFPLPLVNVAVPQKIAESLVSSRSGTFLKKTLTWGKGGTKMSFFQGWHNNLQLIIDKSKLIYYKQSGFRSLHPPVSCLLKSTNDLYVNLDKGRFTATVFIDLKKAFDTVDHDTLTERNNLLIG